MAHLHFRRTVYKRGSTKASDRIAYVTGQARPVPRAASRQVQYLSHGREDLVSAGTRNLPAWADGNPHTYFRAAEQYERANGVAFEEWKVTLPVELSRDQHHALLGDLLDMIAGDRLPCTYAFHVPLTLDGTHEQPHLHLLLSARQTDGIPRSPQTHFTRWNATTPAAGGARKDPAFWVQGAVTAHRLMIADIVNCHLEAAGLAARVHPETLVSRGIAREPEPKLLPSESAAYRETGRVGKTMARVLQVRTQRRTTRIPEQNNASAFWEARKAVLGITRDMGMEEKLAHILRTRHGHIARVPPRSRRILEHTRPRTQTRREERDVMRAQLAALVRQVEGWEEEPSHGGVRGRVPGLEEERGYG